MALIIPVGHFVSEEQRRLRAERRAVSSASRAYSPFRRGQSGPSVRPLSAKTLSTASQIRAVDGRGDLWCGLIELQPPNGPAEGVTLRVHLLRVGLSVHIRVAGWLPNHPASAHSQRNTRPQSIFSAPTICNPFFSDHAVRLLLQTQAYKMTQVGPPGIAPLAINISDCEPGEPGESSPVGAGLQGARA